jgi:hypothetical protein
MDLDEMLNLADTGDIVLFNNPMAATYLIKWTTDSKWDHVGMILKYSENPAETILVESAGCGVFICYARDRLIQVLDDPSPSVIGWRRLVPRKLLDAPWKKRMHREAEKLIDTPYEQNFSDFVKAWIGEDATSKWILSHLGGTLKEGATKGEDLNSLFCSELCAHMLKFGNLMDPKFVRDANAYAPRDFASQTNAHLNLKYPFELEQEIQVLYKLGKHEEAQFQKKYGVKAGSAPVDPNNPNAKHKTLNSMVQSNSAGKDPLSRRQSAMHNNQSNLLAVGIKHAEENLKKAQASGTGVAEAEEVLNELKSHMTAHPPASEVFDSKTSSDSESSVKAMQEGTVNEQDSNTGDVEPTVEPEKNKGGGCCR